MRVEHLFFLRVKVKNMVGSGIQSHTCHFLVHV